jgi:hypothetical protein
VVPTNIDKPSIKVISFFIEVSLRFWEVDCALQSRSLQPQMNFTLRRY